MNQVMRTAVLFTFMIMLLSCSRYSETSSELENQFSTLVPLTDVNKSLQVVVEDKETSFETGSDINLLIYNKSSNSIYFNNDSYVTLLTSPDHMKWLEVTNEITYFGTTKALPQGTSLLDFVHTVIRPVLDKTKLDPSAREIVLRVVITGEIMKEDVPTGKKVGAYIDVFLKP